MANLPGVFKINRVNKAIVSLAEHVESAQKIAESIPQIRTAVLNLRDEDRSQSVPMPPPTPIPKQENDLQLGAIFPKTICPPEKETERLFLVVVDKGNPTDFSIKDSNGKTLNWNIKSKNKDNYFKDKRHEHLKSLVNILEKSNCNVVLLLLITIPSGLAIDSSYHFVATSQDSKKEDQLLLTVSNQEFNFFITESN